MHAVLDFIQIQLIEKALTPLEAEWITLWQQCPDASPFQHPNWLMAWWQHFGNDKELQTVTFRHRGQLVGVAPLCVHREAQMRKLMPVGIGLSDYLDMLFAPGFETLGAQELIAYLGRSSRVDWEVCDLQPLTKNSPLLHAPTPGSLRSAVEPTDTLTSLELPSDFEVFEQRLSPHFKDRLRDARRYAARHGSIHFDFATADTFDYYFDHLLKFHRARWGEASSSVQSQAVDSFHRQAALAMLAGGTLRLAGMKIGTRIVAVLYGFVHQYRGYFYMSGFDRAFEKASPGVLLITYAVQDLIREGMRECNFLRGREAYKYRWGICERPTYARRLEHA